MHRAHRRSCRCEGWCGDSVDSTTAFCWSAACPFWQSATCALDGHKDEFVQQVSLPLYVCVCVWVLPRAAALGLLEEMVSVTMR